MLITIKTLQQKSFKIEIEDSESVATLKKKIEEEQGSTLPAAGIRLIYAGKILSDASPISEYNILESNFVVVMVSKTKTQPSKQTTPATTSTQPSTATPQTSSTSETPPLPVPAPTPTVAPIPPTSTPAPTPMSVVAPPSDHSSSEAGGGGGAESTDRGRSEAPFRDDWQQSSTMLTAQTDIDEAIANIMAMGYERDEVEAAMRASYNDPNRAADYLVNGMPLPRTDDVPVAQEGRGAQQLPTPTPQAEAGGELQSPPTQPPAAAPPSASGLEPFFSNPEFNNLRRTLRQNPHLLQPLLQQIGQSNPALLSMISQNQQSFIQMLNSESGPGSEFSSAAGGQQQQPQPPSGESPGGPGLAPMAIQVTPQEKEAIDRLSGMGFPEHLVIQAYFACEKNEELATEFLLNQDPNDD